MHPKSIDKPEIGYEAPTWHPNLPEVNSYLLLIHEHVCVLLL